jgi:serine/threonine-protein kinase
VGAALGYAHDHNVIHSDLKPANIFLTNSGRTKLLDFGIARVSRGPLLRQRSGPLALTPAYASCEMLEGEEADARDDIYTFACVIYEMLCGKRPFGELTALEARETGAQVPPLQGLLREQNAALAKGLAFDRERRTASVEELLAGLVADQKLRRRRPVVLAAASIVAVTALAFTYLLLDKLWIYKRSVVVQSVSTETQPLSSRAAATVAAFSPPPHSIAVLPFLNMSGDKEQDYFSDGLSEELLNDLSRINELQVAARTSSFYFKGKDADLPTIAHKLNVASVLEGSVRRSGNRIRITAQLNNAATGFHLWSQTYDRDIGDVLQLQTEIATAVAAALKVTLLGDVGAKIELGGTRNPAAFDAYLRASKAYRGYRTRKNLEAVIPLYTGAIRLDPDYALAYADRSIAQLELVTYWVSGSAVGDYLNKAQADARKAIALAPDLAEGHLALAVFFATSLDFRRASEEFERAVALEPGNARVLQDYGRFAVNMDHTEAGLAALRRAVALDPLDVSYHASLIFGLRLARRYVESLAAYQKLLAFLPDNGELQLLGATTYYALGDFQSARSLCDFKLKKGFDEHIGAEAAALLAVCQYPSVSRDADVETALRAFKTARGDDGAYEYAKIYVQWGDTGKAIEWLETAVRLRIYDLRDLKVEPLLDPLRKEPRFQAIERDLRFPE